MTQKKDHVASGSAIAGAGAVTAGTGFVAGGVPGAKSNVSAVTDLKLGTKKPMQTAKDLAHHPRVARALPGGILGFRHNAHAGGIYGFKQQSTKDAWKGPAKDSAEAFWRGRNEGKIAPEETILRHMKGAKQAAGVAMAGGAAATAYGIHRARQKVNKSQRASDKFNGALLGAGGAGAALSGGATHVLRGQERKWAGEASRSTNEAGKLVHATEHDITKTPKIIQGVHPDVAVKAGRLRGTATQGRHFAEIYGSTAKAVGRFRTPSLVAAAAGAGGLAMSRKKPVSKRMSAFGVEH